MRAILTAAAFAPAGAALAAPAGDDLHPIVVIAPGDAPDRDDALTIDRREIARTGKPDVLAALTRTIAGVTLQDAQGNPWQPALVYRGFVASPLQGAAQGLAAYLDGGRFNQPFGDTVGFDLIPDAAIRSITLLDASPVYGFNALGGALVIETATGMNDPGFSANLAAGSYGTREASVSAGRNDGRFSWFVAGQARREDGWRAHSPSRLANGYADVGYDGDSAGLHAKLVVADTDLTGNGVAPVDLLGAAPNAVFTWPDNARSRYARISLHPQLSLSPQTHLEGTVYRQRLTVRSINGDLADIAPCAVDLSALCAQDLNAREALLPGMAMVAPSIASAMEEPVYGVLNRATSQTRAWGILAQVIDKRALGSGTNHLAAGFSFDSGRTDFVTSVELAMLGEDRRVAGLGEVIGPGDGPVGPVSLIARSDNWGLFVADTLPIAPGLSAEIGLRWNHALIRLEDRIGSALNGAHHYARLNPGLEFDWKLSPGLALRAGYAETNRTPTPAELSCASEDAPCSLANFFVADPHLKAVVARTLELGASGGADVAGWRIEWLASFYRTVNSDDIQHVASRVRGRAYFRNIGRTRRQGLELGVKARRGGWRVDASYAFTDAVSLSALTLSSPDNPFADADGTIAVSRGNRLPGVPRHSATLAIDHETRIGARSATFGGDVVVRSGQVLIGDAANLTPPVPGYMLVNLRGSIELAPGLSLTGEVRNLFNRSYATVGTFGELGDLTLAEAPGASSPRFYGPGAPRRWTLGVAARF
ncbi:TonB-dependent receptor [Novosphingobium sp. KCTC 2891]|nr:TonB-dependent receptor [Novosphingobium sp. KCTC 2891]MCW1384714.1 TonB-dependent receptor [Novosphingobium sp. KCTC 2891]